MPVKRQSMAKCSYMFANGKLCDTYGWGDPALCKKHEKFRDTVEEELRVEGGGVTAEFVGAVFDVPVVKRLLEKLGGLVDKAGVVVEAADINALMERLSKRAQVADPPDWVPTNNKVNDAKAILGFTLNQTLTVELIKQRKRDLAAIYHPDKGSGNAEKMQIINAAADVLLKHEKF